ncbi:exodeoxyribonuclease VII small subunit [Desulfosudis oleivorans]|uniref:Exodeoxyribonuclease 7 small subunit n=1 Tax=Desulfosudis oleivorans (strain DSM 6200 / JCM 39069 / Hxd3) TaxID=96561 RepID=A9A0G8_DESOH|nr:exodeoxyribonuclease VII small subunit [Desulfosudis oleivorans]ABW67468.1 exodeoxyribonuclease VII, small subunit [Desulfosudis oleivorans Hxd3]
MATQKNFEQSLQKLEQIVEEIESGALPLEQALKKFEAGVKLSEECTALLNDAEKKVRILMKDKDGNPISAPFASDDDREES